MPSSMTPLLPFAVVFTLVVVSVSGQYVCDSQSGVKRSQNINAMEGTVMDGVGGIRSNTWCEYLIRPPAKMKNGRVKLTFKSVHLLSGDDFVWVYDIGSNIRVPVERITGTYVPKPIYSSSSKGFMVEYRSSTFGVDNAVAQEQGFEASFKMFSAKGVCRSNPCSKVATCFENDKGKRTCKPCPIGFTGNSNRPDGCVPIRPCDRPLVRKEIRSLSPSEFSQFMEALQGFRNSGHYDQVVWTHANKDNFNFAHLTDAFLPWHRQYVLMLERGLRSVSATMNCMTMPYWDWTLDAANPMGSPMFTEAMFGGTGVDRGNGKSCVANGPFRDWKILGNECLQRQLGKAGFIATREEILNVIASNRNYRDFARAIELFHDTVHRFIGGTMTMGNSADEPLFLLHHSFIDMLYSIWQDCNEYDLIPSANVQPNSGVYGGGFETGSLGAPISTALTNKMPFRMADKDPNVAPQDVLNLASLGISYDNAAFLADPMTIEWFDPRWTQCSIERLETFKTNPDLFTGPPPGQFQALSIENSIPVPMKERTANFDSLQVARPIVLVPLKRFAQPISPEVVCMDHTGLNFTQQCGCFRLWTRKDLLYVAQTFPSCHRRELLACAATKKR